MTNRIIALSAVLLTLIPASAQRLELGSSTAVLKAPTADGLKTLRDEGIKYIEVALNQCYRKVNPDSVDERINRLKRDVDASGLTVWSIHLPFSRTLDISVNDDAKRAENVKLMKYFISKSKMFAPEYLILHPSSEPIYDEDRASRLANAVASIKELRDYASSLGLEICIENLPRTCLGNTPEELSALIDSVGGVGVCFDTNHYLRGSAKHFIDILGTRIKTLHCSDFDLVNECHWLPTQGKIDWDELISMLEDKGYRGVMMYEVKKDAKTKKLLTPGQIKQSYLKIMNNHEK